MKMTLDEARRIIADSEQPLSLLTEAAAAIAASGEITEDDREFCLRIGGLPAELVHSHVPNDPTVIILEDDVRRADTMIQTISRTLPGWPSRIFVDSCAMIEWMKNHQQGIHLISLDHDLNDYRDASGKTRPAGTGRDVADFLSSLTPTCPIIIHSSNAPAALGMSEELRSAGWPIFRVYPHDDLQWIESDWADELRRLRDNGWLGEGLRSAAQPVRTSLR